MKEGEATTLRQGFHLHDFYSLCRGEKFPFSTAPPSPLCYLSAKDDPHLLLAPLKVEEVSREPPILMFHDFLNEREMAYMRNNAMADLEAATVQDTSVSDGGGSKVSNERSQASGWLYDPDHPLLYQLSRRVSRMTGLEVAAPKERNTKGWFVEAEAWQLGVYGPGGHYLPHYDAFDILDPQSRTPDGLWVGNRLATVLFYLSDVDGGATAFHKLGLAVRPRVGSAVFWYNLHSNGSRDERTIHGACPTVRGIKWVSNKWVREGAQVWRRPCS